MSRSALKGIQAAAGAAGEALYVDDVFSTFLYEGNGTNPHTITNGIDLAGEGGLVWTKARDSASIDNVLVDTVRATGWLVSNGNQAAAGTSTAYLSFNENGYDIDNTFNNWNGSTIGDYVSWTFRKAPKFFDIVTYTGNGTDGRTVSHNLGSVPGCIIIKRTDASSTDWIVYHQQLNNGTDPEDYYLILNGTGAENNAWIFNKTAPTDTIFTVGSVGNVNASGGTYIAYLFAHNNSDGEFGEDGDQDIIKCGSYTGTGSYSSPPVIDLGFEPQWVMIKNTTSTTDWLIGDVMRGATSQIIGSAGEAKILKPNSSNAEASYSGGYIPISPTSTGFTMSIDGSEGNASGNTYIYMAIRRPNKPASEFAATDLFKVDNGQSSSPAFTAGFPPDFALFRDTGGDDFKAVTRLLGDNYLITASTAAVASNSLYNFTTFQDSWLDFAFNSSWYSWMFRRAPGYFDVVAYTGNGTAGRTVNHNLGVTPELMIIKLRSEVKDWYVYTQSQGASKRLTLNDDSAPSNTGAFNSTEPTAGSFTLGDGAESNGSSKAYIAYLFASVNGISKVGSYTGTGNNVDVNCGFSAGARFVLIKRTDSTGDWYVWDSERGIVAGNDPYLLLNTTAAEVTSTDYIDPLSSGFTVTSSAPAALNNSGGTYIFLAIA
jgi:hypothetical protein